MKKIKEVIIDVLICIVFIALLLIILKIIYNIQ